MNPIKTPREMLFEMAGLSYMAGGGKAGQISEMYKLITQAIERYTKAYGRPPSPEDVQALKQHAKEISQKAEIKTDPATQARARHQMATDPNLINPEGPDPFLTKAMTGRTVKGTYIQPKALDINDPNVRQNIEVKQQAGALEDILPESITPSADYMGRMGTSIENQALASGKIPMIDKLKAAFFAKHKRYPTDEELEVIIAEFNPARHQYGEKGASIVSERPPTAKGMADWKQQARTEGIPETFIEKTPGNYPKYLQDELELSRGVQPGTKPLSNERINPDRSYSDGRSVAALSPREMEAMLVVQGNAPEKYNDKYQRAIAEARKKGIPAAETTIEKILRRANLPFAGMSGYTAGERLAEGKPGEAALYGTAALGSGLATSKKYFKPGLGIVGGASVPMSLDDAIERFKRGDRTGAVISTIEAAGNAAAMFPPTAIPGTVLSLGSTVANAIKDTVSPTEYKSVMEDYK